MELTLLSGLLVAVCGVVVGVLSAMFGIGGGTIMVPLIHLVFGQPPAVASGTSLFAILPTSIASMVNRLHDGTINFRVGLAAGLAGACLSPLGAFAASTLPGEWAMVLTSCFIFFTAYNMFKRAHRAKLAAVQAMSTSSQVNAPKLHRAPLQDATGARLYGSVAALGALVGFLSGYVGLGGGFLIVPMLQWAYGFTMKQATGTSLVAVALFAVPSCVAHAYFGNVVWFIGLLLIAGSLVGSRLGAAAIKRVNDRVLTVLFGIVLVISGIILTATQLWG